MTPALAGCVAAIAGRRFDKPDGPPRFPRSNDALVRRRIRDVLERRRVQTLVASAACGADLAALEIAEQLRIRRVVFLPHDPETFRERSVVDRAPDWGSRYDRVIEALRAAGDLHVLNAPGSGDAAYRATSDALLSETLKLAATSHVPAIAIVVWDGESRGPDDFTDHFRQSAAIRELPIEEVGTL